MYIYVKKAHLKLCMMISSSISISPTNKSDESRKFALLVNLNYSNDKTLRKMLC